MATIVTGTTKITLTWADIEAIAGPILAPLLQPFANFLLGQGVDWITAWIALAQQNPDDAVARLYAAMTEDALTAQIIADGAALDGAVVANADNVAAQKAWLGAFLNALVIIAQIILQGLIGGMFLQGDA